MAWLKKNLFIVIAGVVSLGLLGYAVFFLMAKIDQDKTVTEELDGQAAKFQELVNRKVHPGTDKVNNIQLAKDEHKKLQDFMGEVRQYLSGPELPTNMTSRDFRALLDTTVTQLRQDAQRAGITLPVTNFWFTFSAHKSAIDFKGDHPGLAAQLGDIKAIMHVLYDARVHSLVGCKRVPVTDGENNGFADYIANRTPKTNDWAITTGYEVTFQGFSSELARVMEGLANAKECFIVKSVNVAQAPVAKTAQPAVPMFQPPPMMDSGMSRYRMMMNPGMMRPMMPAPAATAPKPVQKGMKLLLDENKLRFTLLVDSVRLKPKAR